jgi:hypothetical protein
MLLFPIGLDLDNDADERRLRFPLRTSGILGAEPIAATPFLLGPLLLVSRCILIFHLSLSEQTE